HVDVDRCRASPHDHIGRSRERVRDGDNLVTRADPEGLESEEESCGPTRHIHGVVAADEAAHILLKLLTLRFPGAGSANPQLLVVPAQDGLSHLLGDDGLVEGDELRGPLTVLDELEAVIGADGRGGDSCHARAPFVFCSTARPTTVYSGETPRRK